ncbi:MAG: hypothetical protein ABSC93_27870 [Bryobacteraceae bacterium]
MTRAEGEREEGCLPGCAESCLESSLGLVVLGVGLGVVAVKIIAVLTH